MTVETNIKTYTLSELLSITSHGIERAFMLRTNPCQTFIQMMIEMEFKKQ